MFENDRKWLRFLYDRGDAKNSKISPDEEAFWGEFEQEVSFDIDTSQFHAHQTLQG